MVGGRGRHLREDAAAPVWSCCFVPPQSAEIAQINLLFARLGQYVCVLCAYVCKCLLSSIFSFTLIKCSRVTTDECPRDALGFPKAFWYGSYSKSVWLRLLVFISYVMCMNLLTHICVCMCVSLFVCTSCSCVEVYVSMCARRTEVTKEAV